VELGEEVIARTNTLTLVTGRVSFRSVFSNKVHYSSKLSTYVFVSTTSSYTEKAPAKRPHSAQRAYKNRCVIDTTHAMSVSTQSCLHLIFSSSLLPLLRFRVEVAFCSSGYFVLTLPFLLCERKCRHF
jgi:hypothetical protein